MRDGPFQAKLKEKSIDIAVFFSLDQTPNMNIVYFTGYSGLGIFVVPKEKPAFLVVPEMEYEKAKKTNNKVFKPDGKKRLLETVAKLVSDLNIKKVGIEEAVCSVFLYKKLKKAINARYVDVSEMCYETRMIKDGNEITKIRKACGITDRIFLKICKKFNFKTEKQIKDFILNEFKKNNCDPAYPPIVASSKNSNQPHYSGESKLKNGFLLLDFGAKYRGYCSDMTRMLYLGKPKKEEVDDYNLVLNTILGCEKALTENKKFSDMYDLSVKLLGEKSKYFTHGLGHGVGLEIHEAPSLSIGEKIKIQESVAFTIEPGIYFPDKYGIRVEDTIFMGKNNFKILTNSTKKLIVIKKGF